MKSHSRRIIVPVITTSGLYPLPVPSRVPRSRFCSFFFPMSFFLRRDLAWGHNNLHGVKKHWCTAKMSPYCQYLQFVPQNAGAVSNGGIILYVDAHVLKFDTLHNDRTLFSSSVSRKRELGYLSPKILRISNIGPVINIVDPYISLEFQSAAVKVCQGTQTHALYHSSYDSDPPSLPSCFACSSWRLFME